MNNGNFADRLRAAIGAGSVNGFASRCPEVSGTLLRKYLEGSEPGLSKIVAIARAAGVTVEWLATCAGPMRPGDALPPVPAPAAPAAIDSELLACVQEGVAEVYRSENARVYPRALAKEVARIYGDLAAAYDRTEERLSGLKLALHQLRRELRSPPAAGTASSKQVS